MTPNQFKNHARYLWGGHWYVALANKLGITPDDVRSMMDGDAMPIAATRILMEGMMDRRDGCADRVREIAPHTLQAA